MNINDIEARMKSALDHIQSEDSKYMRPFIYSLAFIKTLDALLLFIKEDIEKGVIKDRKSIDEVDFIIVKKNDIYGIFKTMYKGISGQELKYDAKEILEEIFKDFLIDTRNPEGNDDENDYYISKIVAKHLITLMKETAQPYSDD